MYSMIFSQLLERIARKPGFEWSGNDNELKAYSLSLKKYAPKIVGYDKAKEEMLKYYDLADYEDPNDNTKVGSKQYSMLHGVLHFYSRLYIMEYLARAMPYYLIFDYPKNYYNFTEVSVDYIVQMIEQDFGYSKFDSYNPIFNATFDYVRIKNEIEFEGYTGFYRGLKYYISQNFNDVYQLFIEHIPLGFSEVLPNYPQKQKFDLEKGIFLAGEPSQTGNEQDSTIIALDVHTYAGQPKIDPSEQNQTITPSTQDQTGQWSLLLGTAYDFAANDWKEKDTIMDFSDESYSLFGPNYKYFKNGMFFIQNYISFDVGETMIGENNDIPFSYFDAISAKNNLKGFVGRKSLFDINSALDGGEYNGVPFQHLDLNQFFVEGSLKMGSRLCYGIAYNPTDDSADPEVQNFAKKMFKNYTTNNDLASNLFKGNQFISGHKKRQFAAEMASLNKYLICVDGPSAKFSAKATGTTAAGASYYAIDGTFSIVLPVFNREQNISMDQPWINFLNTYAISDTGQSGFAGIQAFKNLNEDLLNSDEYHALKTNCFSLKNMLHFNAFSGLAYYGNNPELESGFKQTKKVLNSSIDTIINGAKNSDYNYRSALNATGETS